MLVQAKSGMRRIGIDLGTTNTVAAVEAEILQQPEQSGAGAGVNLPSVVAFLPNGTTSIGQAARRRRAIDPKNTIFSSKRLMGRKFSASGTTRFKQQYPFDLVEMEGGNAGFKTRAGTFSPEDLARMIIAAACRNSGVDPEKMLAVITVPAECSSEQKEATIRAGMKAGLPRVMTLDEPAATAFAYAKRGFSGLAAVYDLGGGTFDFAVVDCSRTPALIVSHGTDPYLGGDDVDHALAAWVAQEVLMRHNWDLRRDPTVYDRLVFECERAKIRLTQDAHTKVELSEVDPVASAAESDLGVDRALLRRLIANLLRRTFITCDKVMSAIGKNPKDVDAVFMAGGSALLPMVREGVEHYFGKRPVMDVSPMEVVAIGASIAAAHFYP